MFQKIKDFFKRQRNEVQNENRQPNHSPKEPEPLDEKTMYAMSLVYREQVRAREGVDEKMFLERPISDEGQVEKIDEVRKPGL